MIVLKVDDSKLQGRMRSVRARIDRNMSNDLRLSAKRTAFYCHEYTLPVSTAGNPWPMTNFMGRVEEDVKKAYGSKDDIRWQASAFALIKDNYGEDKAKEFWHAFKGGDQSSFDPDNPTRLDYEESFDRMRKIPRRVDPAAYSDLRKRRTILRKRVRILDPKVKPIGFVQGGTRAAFIRRRQETIGLAKAGWYAVDTALGGTRNFKRAENEAGRFIWPAQLRKLQSKFGRGIGTGAVNATKASGTWRITNAVRYSDEALPDTLREKAFELGRNAMRVIFQLRFKNKATYAAA